MQAGAKEISVTWDDQQNINQFGKLNNRLHELKAEVLSHQKTAEDYEEASNELMITDEEEVMYVLGECFAIMPNDDAETRLQEELDKTQEKISALHDEESDIKSQMEALKKVLYGKFGDSINLEEE
mmetsp:Transcript_40962/g.49713  ORF Transcript_40962/g.49713 Transcript_40962/m.49713 type:complete len:126 (+) Transcript_40962:175-552(+)|eukprot:CAMPEP_0197847886 /NCGR_PEP_ID=MMETSP1438-20131217/7401_1 /TAXON_ID=1461541 /ORGANISM="Pterosperma sp., Strain CCMP1384" /LENGTH=125 /DNA_ID=CAMNT_0043459949 /DNA_START=174 /DNA_END=551 /DNA_ORIENTATION=+